MKTILGARRLGILALMCGLSACGGGGSSASTDTGYPLDSAMSAFFQAQHSYSLTASTGSDHYILLRRWQPGGMQTFQGVSAFSTVQIADFSDNGSSVSGDIQTKFFLTGPYKLLGSIDTDGRVFVSTKQTALPDLASPGDSGKFFTSKRYTDASLTTVELTDVMTWDLTAVTADTAMLCFEDASTATGSSFTSTSSLCYIMDQRGNITAIQNTVTLGGVQLTFK